MVAANQNLMGGTKAANAINISDITKDNESILAAAFSIDATNLLIIRGAVLNSAFKVLISKMRVRINPYCLSVPLLGKHIINSRQCH
jgi:hypothetical protein